MNKENGDDTYSFLPWPIKVVSKSIQSRYTFLSSIVSRMREKQLLHLWCSSSDVNYTSLPPVQRSTTNNVCVNCQF